MKKTGYIVLILTLLCCLPAQAQFGGLIKKAKETKEKVDKKVKKAKGEFDFYYLNEHRGYYNSKKHLICLDDRYNDGELASENITYSIMDNGEVIRNDGKQVAQLLDNGAVNCHDCAPYLIIGLDGDVVMDDEVIGHIDNISGKVTMEGFKIADVKGIDRQIAAFIIYGIMNNKERIANLTAQCKEDRKRENEERKQAAARQEAERKSREWTIEKNGNRGYVDGTGAVYNWAHKKIGQLPEGGNGDIKDASGFTIGRINMGDIYDRNGNKLASVSTGGTIYAPGSNNPVADVKGGGRIDMTKDSKTLGYCDVRPYVWAVVLIYCDFFRF